MGATYAPYGLPVTSVSRQQPSLQYNPSEMSAIRRPIARWVTSMPRAGPKYRSEARGKARTRHPSDGARARVPAGMWTATRAQGLGRLTRGRRRVQAVLALARRMEAYMAFVTADVVPN